MCVFGEGGGGGEKRGGREDRKIDEGSVGYLSIHPPTGVSDQKSFLLLCLDALWQMIHSSSLHKGPFAE